MRNSWWRRKVVTPIQGLLRQGLTPRELAFTIALGVALGMTPVLGSTALLCTLAAFIFRLNLVAVQLVNWVVYPLQLALLLPFLRMGAWMFRQQASDLSVVSILALIHANLFHAIETLWRATMHALVAWFLVGCIATGVLYVLLVPILYRVRNGLRPAMGE